MSSRSIGCHCWLAQQCLPILASALALLVALVLHPAGGLAQTTKPQIISDFTHYPPLGVREPQAKPKSPDPGRFESEIAAFEKWDAKNSSPRDAILFVGSSTIRLWPTAESFPGLPVINRGFGGSHISDLNHFADRIVFKYKPRTIVFYSGDNDTAAGKLPAEVIRDFDTFAGRVHERLPKTRLIYLAIKPSPSRFKLWPNMQKINAHAEARSKNDVWLTYIDTATPMLESQGQPRKDLYRNDGLHLNARGYELWTAIVAPVIRDSSIHP